MEIFHAQIFHTTKDAANNAEDVTGQIGIELLTHGIAPSADAQLRERNRVSPLIGHMADKLPVSCRIANCDPAI